MIIFYNLRRGLTQQQCIDEFNSIFCDKASSRTSVYRWYGEFNPGRNSIQNECREGRSKSVGVPEIIDAVCQLILQAHASHETYREIETTLFISGTSTHSILHEHLIFKKNMYALDPTKFINRSKKGSCQLVERNAPKIQSLFFETRL